MFGTDCTYKPHDIESCSLHLENLVPKEDVANCNLETFQRTNWTAYCHYLKSFESIRVDINTERVPFLGGLNHNMETMCQTSMDIYQNATTTCPKLDTNWFSQCFDRTENYELHCSSECLDKIEMMLSDNGPNDRGICEIRSEYLDITTKKDGITSTGISENCNCDMQDIIITDFCLIQDAYHDGAYINIPELYNSECSYGCRETLKKSMDRSEWRQWCSDLSTGDISGVCSKTVCECDTDAPENAGVSGRICELTCPAGISDGKELACSGRNGQCFAINPDESVSDEDEKTKQRAAFETRLNTNFSGPYVPEWKRGPSPTMDGRCQCALGSGVACSIPCAQCNNGTYGYEMASQYGICDSFNAICRSLPSFMLYNTKIE